MFFFRLSGKTTLIDLCAEALGQEVHHFSSVVLRGQEARLKTQLVALTLNFKIYYFSRRGFECFVNSLARGRGSRHKDVLFVLQVNQIIFVETDGAWNNSHSFTPHYSILYISLYVWLERQISSNRIQCFPFVSVSYRIMSFEQIPFLFPGSPSDLGVRHLRPPPRPPPPRPHRDRAPHDQCEEVQDRSGGIPRRR